MQKLSLGSSNRTIVTIDQIPEDLQHAVVAIEDERFYQHKGIDIRGILRAGIHGLASGRFDQGASTITQQLLKNSVFTGWMEWNPPSLTEFQQKDFRSSIWRSSWRKPVGIGTSILQDYLNTINLGAGHATVFRVGCPAVTSGSSVSANWSFPSAPLLAGCYLESHPLQPHHPPGGKCRTAGRRCWTTCLKQGYISTEEAYEGSPAADDVYARKSQEH